MRVLINEYITSGALSDQVLPSSLQREGLLMLTELVRLSCLLTDVQPIITLDSRIDYQPENVEVHKITNAADYHTVVKDLLCCCDVAWVIAPESDGILYESVRVAEVAGVTTVNCDPATITLCADKYQSAVNFTVNHVPMVTTDFPGVSSQNAAEWVIKPRYGVGCEQVKIFADADRPIYQDRIENPHDWVEQPYIEGKAGSVCLFAWNQRVQILSYNEQQLKRVEDGIELKRCVTNASAVRALTCDAINRLVQNLPGLKGVVGVDIVETEEQTWIVEINPRLTTSAVGLYDAKGINIVELAIDCMRAGQLEALQPSKNQPVFIDVR